MFAFSEGGNIIIFNHCTSNNNNYVSKYNYKVTQKYELNGGSINFTVKSLEVYHVEY